MYTKNITLNGLTLFLFDENNDINLTKINPVTGTINNIIFTCFHIDVKTFFITLNVENRYIGKTILDNYKMGFIRENKNEFRIIDDSFDFKDTLNNIDVYDVIIIDYNKSHVDDLYQLKWISDKTKAKVIISLGIDKEKYTTQKLPDNINPEIFNNIFFVNNDNLSYSSYFDNDGYTPVNMYLCEKKEEV